MILRVEIEQEEDGRWIADVVDLPGVMVYGSSARQAVASVKALALRVLAGRKARRHRLGPRMRARIARQTGLRPEDL